MDNEYKISLGVEIDTKDIQNQINSKKLDPIKLEVDIDTAKLAKKIETGLKASMSGSKTALTLDTASVEKSLGEVSATIKEIRSSIGMLDSKSGMKSLLSSINQISSALEKASDQFEGLNKNLNALSSKDLSLNLGINIGGSNSVARNAAYGSKVRNETLPQLKQQMSGLVKYYNSTYKESLNEFEALQKLVSGTKLNNGDFFESFLFGKDSVASRMNGGSLSSQMQAYKQYIDMFKQAASLKGLDLSAVTSSFSKSADDLIKDAQDIQTGAKEMDEGFEKLKQVFGGGNNLNIEGISSQLDSIVVDLGEIKTAIQGLSSEVSLDGLTQSFNRLSDAIELILQKCTNAQVAVNNSIGGLNKAAGQTADGSGLQKAENELKKIKDLARQIGQLDFKIVKSDYNGEINQVREFERQLSLLKTQYNETLNSLNGKDIDIGSEITKEFTEARNKIAEFEAKVADAKSELAKDIKSNIGTNIAKNINSVHSDFERLSNKAVDLQKKLDLLDSIKVDLDTAAANDDIDGLIAANERYENVLKEVKAQLDINKRAEQDANSADSLTTAKENALLRLKNLFGNNSEAAKRFGSEVERLQRELNECGNIAGINKLNKDITNLGLKVKEAGVQTQTFGQKLKKQFSQYSSYLSVASLFMYAEQGLRDMFKQVVAIDTAMTELKKVTDETDASYNKFLNNAASRSKELGTTIDGLVESTADFARLGYGFEDSQGLAEVANIYAVVGDEIDGVETATKSLISTLAAFKDEMNGMSDSDFALSIVDKFNEVSNNFAISSGGIGEALQRSASSLAAANNTLDESIALITAANTVVQDPTSVGTAFKTISMRIRGAKTELEEAGLETEGMVESTAKLRSEILALTGVDIMDGANQFKSTYAIMDELAAKWQDLTDIQQATVTELIAGKRQGNIVSSLMSNFDIARDALETSLESSGSAMREHEKWQQSLEARINKLKSTWQSLSQTFMKSDFLKVGLDVIAGFVDVLDKLIDKLGALPTILGTVAAGMSLFKNKGLFTFDKDSKSIQILGNNLLGLKDKYAQIQTAISRYNSISSKSVSFQEKYNKVMAGSSTSMGKYLSGLNGAKASFGGYIGSLVGATVKTIALEAATMALNAAMTMGISFLISAGISGIMKLVNAKKELAEQVDELTSKFKEQHGELTKNKGSFESEAARYAKLSKGVDRFGRNVSLTADEYSEYQSIVNSIADQVPSLVSGYDSQGNAILGVKDNVEELTEAYEKLIHAQNQAILANSGDIEKDFNNTLKNSSGEGLWSNNHGFWAGFLNGIGGTGAFSENYDLKDDTVKRLENLLNASGKAERDNIYREFLNDDFSREELRTALERANVDIGYFDDPTKVLEETLKTDPAKIKGIIDDYYGQFTDAVNKQKTIALAKLSEAFDVGSAISGLDYGNISENLQNVAYQVVNSLDKDFFDELQEDGTSVESWVESMLDQLNAIGKEDNAKIEAAFDLQTKFNGGEISYGEYVDGLEDTGRLVDSLKLKKSVKNQIKLSLGLDKKGLVEEYQQLKNRLADSELFNIMPSEYVPFLDSLSAEELSILVDIIPDLSETEYRETIEDVKAALEREMMLQGLTFELNLEVEATGIEALNTALAESVSATGLSSESISALKGRYADLEAQGYDLSSMFEETSHGIHLNRQEFNKLEKAYATQKLEEVGGQLDEMKVTYDDLGKQIKNCTDPVEKAKLFSDRQLLSKRISEAATLAAQYEGLTSAYNDWLAAEEAGQERDMYEKVIEGFENIDDEISRGWLDDGTIEFLELLTGKDLSTSSIENLKAAYDGLDKTIKNTTYSVRDFFTVDEDGNSTNTGVYNFLDAIGQLEEEKFGGKDVVKRDKDGNIIAFDFEVAGGDEAIADALGISKELVQIMVRAADDAGFVVSMDGTYRQLADLQNEARAAANYLHEIGKTDFEFDFNTSSASSLTDQLVEANKVLDKFKDKDGNIDLNADGATQAMTIVSTLQAKLDTLTQEKYGIGLKVEDEQFEEPLENLQNYGRKVATLNQLELNPKANAEEIEQLNGELDSIAEYFANLDGEFKTKLGFEADDGIEDVKKKIESGEVKIPTVLDIQANMDKNIETLTDLALLNSGLLSEDEEEVIRKKYSVKVEADEVDTTDVEEKVDGAVAGAEIGTMGDGTRELNIDVIADTFGIENVEDLSSKLKGLDDKTIEAIAEVVGQIDVDKLKNTIAKLKPKEVEAIAKAIGEGDVDALKTAIGQLKPRHVKAIAEALGYSDVDELNAAIEGMDGNTVQAVAQALGITDVDTLQAAIDGMQGNTVDAKVNTDGQIDKINGLQGSIDGLHGNTVDIFVNTWKTTDESVKKVAGAGKKKAAQRTGANPDGKGGVDGTANVNGTTGRAFKQGSWGTKNSGTALVGELGREVLVRDGRYYTIGDTGAEFIKYKQGDIIFNHAQSEELFKNGKVTSGGGRAKAFTSGTAFSKGSGGLGKVAKVSEVTADGVKGKTYLRKSGEKTKVVNELTIDDGSDTGGSEGSGGGLDPAGGNSVGTEKDKDKFEETFDAVEIAIERIEREIDILDKKANNVYASWSSRNQALTDEITKVGNEIDIQKSAYQAYMTEAGNIGLSEHWASKVRDGTIDIYDESDFDEATYDKIKEYQTWYEKALACEEAIEKLKETEASLYAQRVEHAAAQYEGILGVIEHEKSMLDEYISQAEAQGYLVSEKYYSALASNETDNIRQLTNQRDAMMAAFQTAMDSGKITKGSEAYYDMVSSIDEVTLAIEQSNTALLEYQQTIQQLKWEQFDILQDRISAVTEEADFLIELLSSDKLFDDKGNLTDEGMSTMGLHGQNYNTYMYQADLVAAEVARLKKELKKDPYDNELEEKYRERIAQQQEYILSAQQEKEAIRDLVEEGINLELDALQELIDKKNEALESERDLYEYQKKVKEQTKEIASLEKQMAAFSGDNSEEARAKIQELKVSLEEAKSDLEETEYDKYIQDTQKILDDLYLEYEIILNQRLDNLDALIENSIAEINANASTISATLTETAGSVGTTLSTTMADIWSNEGGTNSIIDNYGKQFTDKQTSTNLALSQIELKLQSIISYLDDKAQKNAKTAKNSSAANPPKDNTGNGNKGNNDGGKKDTSGNLTDDQLTGIAASIWIYGNDSGWGNNPVRSERLINKFGMETAKKVQSIINSKGPSGDLYNFWVKNGKNLDKYKYSAFKLGAKNINEAQLAWTQENGKEFIVRPSDGAILTPIAKGDSVLTSAASNNIWNMANSPAEFIKDNLNLGVTNVPNNSNIQSVYHQTIENVTFDLKNVKNYEELLSAMQKDRNFERLIHAMTVDRLAGKSSLAKGKAIH